MNYEAVIGLEVHCQLKTASKMFCSCKNEYGGAQNTHVCPVCMGLPGSLPTPNEQAIRLTILTGLMLECDIAKLCKFDRKNYFYPDMPKNYQISQYDMPLCKGGRVVLDKFAFPKECQKDPVASAQKHVRLVRIHLEEDVAKSFHLEASSNIDFNRAGTPLMEIVTEADISSSAEAFAFLTTLKQILSQGNVSDADMEKGQLRCDVNISVRLVGEQKLGTKCEIKNLNSISGVRKALEFEIQRQIDVVSKGGKIVQETRRWDDDSGQTYTMRTKEQAHDYRYFPDPDLLPVRTDVGLLDSAHALLPELPQARKERLIRDFGVTDYQADVLASDLALCAYYEKAAAHTPHKNIIANWLLNDFLATEPDTSNITIPPEYFAELSTLVAENKISSSQGKKVFSEMTASNESPIVLVKKLGLQQIMDTAQLEKLCDEAIVANPRSVADYKSGKPAAINALKGFIMKATKGQANPNVVDELLKQKLV
ncbi:MAG: Asp-tRNA(Asn)/Glu-tRNA(Gln) amidotransferase subunit GatB [Verrucomicrobiota bacterium]